MRADQAESLSLRKRGDIGLTADEPLAVVGALEDFVDQKEHGRRGVPAFLVNGKYMVKIESITSQEQFNQLVQFLLAKKD